MEQPRTCRFCNADISEKRTTAKICGGKECAAADHRRTYKRGMSKRTCCKCATPYLGTLKSVLCEQCRLLPRTPTFQQYWRAVACKHCKLTVMAEYVCKTRDFINGEAKVYTVVCDDCKVLSREQQSASKRGEKNPNWTGGHKKIPMSKEQFSARASARMKVDNPMYNPKVAARVHNTIQQKRRTGEIRTLTGPQHWLWRGSRKPSFTLRTRIKPWSREILRRDDFTCQLCGVRGGRLEAHHLVPFKDIVATALQELGLSNLVGMSTESSDFARLADLVVAKHNLGMGVTYCTACHGHTDAARRVKGKKCK